jgi:hypothetical protein
MIQPETVKLTKEESKFKEEKTVAVEVVPVIEDSM